MKIVNNRSDLIGVRRSAYESKHADRDAERGAVFGRHMDSRVDAKTTSFFDARSQRSLTRNLYFSFSSYLLYAPHQDPHSPLLSPGQFHDDSFNMRNEFSISNSLFVLQLHDSLFVNIEVGDSVVIRDPEADFTVTAFDANHCPGIQFHLILCCFFCYLYYPKFQIF